LIERGWVWLRLSLSDFLNRWGSQYSTCSWGVSPVPLPYATLSLSLSLCLCSFQYYFLFVFSSLSPSLCFLLQPIYLTLTLSLSWSKWKPWKEAEEAESAWERTTTSPTECNAPTTLSETTQVPSAPSAFRRSSASSFPLPSLSPSTLLPPLPLLLLSDPTDHPLPPPPALPSPPPPPPHPPLPLPPPHPSPTPTPTTTTTTPAEPASPFSSPRTRRRSPRPMPPPTSSSSAASPPPRPGGTTPSSTPTTTPPFRISVPGKDTAFGPFSTSLPNHPRNSTPRPSETPTPTSTTPPGSLPLTPPPELPLSSPRKTLALPLLSGLTLLSNRTPITAVPAPPLTPLLWSVRSRDPDLLAVVAEASPGTSSRGFPPDSEIALSGGWSLSAKVSPRWQVVALPPWAVAAITTTTIAWRRECGAEGCLVGSWWLRLLPRLRPRLIGFLLLLMMPRMGNQRLWRYLTTGVGVGVGLLRVPWELSAANPLPKRVTEEILLEMPMIIRMLRQTCQPYLPCSPSEAENRWANEEKKKKKKRV